MFSTKISVFIQTPKASEFSVRYYVTEFLSGTWIVLGFVMLFIMFLLGCTMINTRRESSLKAASSFALATTYAAFLSKVRKMCLQDVQIVIFFTLSHLPKGQQNLIIDFESIVNLFSFIQLIESKQF